MLAWYAQKLDSVVRYLGRLLRPTFKDVRGGEQEYNRGDVSSTDRPTRHTHTIRLAYTLDFFQKRGEGGGIRGLYAFRASTLTGSGGAYCAPSSMPRATSSRTTE